MKTQNRPPTATLARKNRAIVCMVMAGRSDQLVDDFVVRIGGVESCGEALLLAVIAGAFPEARAADSGRTMPADDGCRSHPRQACRRRTDPG